MKIIFLIVRKFIHIYILEKGRVNPTFFKNIIKISKNIGLICCIEDIIQFSRGDKNEIYKE